MTKSAESLRSPAVAGRFYPDSDRELSEQVASFLGQAAGSRPRRACAVMAPHAGYVYSGGVAGKVFAAIEVPRRVVLLGPNHTGRGPRISVMDSGAWRIPGADVPVDEELAAAILAEFPAAQPDREAHRFEHALEVELPFLVARQPDLRIVPVVLGVLSAGDAVDFGKALHRAVRAVSQAGDVLVVASSDMSHYLPDDTARQVDRTALAPLLAFDPEGLYRTVVEHDISMCGFIPATAMLAYAREAGASPPELVAYATSAEAFGDHSRVVGYAGVVLGEPGAAARGGSAAAD
jgi:AmmeMemoRadiSam system protein B